MNLANVGRILFASIAGCLAIWHACVLPLRYEIALGTLERATLATITLPDDRARFLAGQTLDTINKYRDRFPHDVRLAMIEGANERIRGQASAAVGAYERALRYDRRPEIYLNLALAEQQLGHRENAARSLANAIRFAPEMAADVSDPRLKEDAIAIIRRGRTAPPFCCAADYDGDGTIEVLETGGGRTTTFPRGMTIASPRGWSPQFSWNEGSVANLIVRADATGAAERLRLAKNGTLLSRQPLPPIGSGWNIAGIGESFAASGTISLLLSNRITGDAKLWTFDPAGHATETPAPSLIQRDAYVAATARFYHDADVDAIYRSSAGKDFIWLLDGTTPVAQAQYFLPSGFHRELVAAADFTGDLQTDLMWYDFETGRTLLWIMNNVSIERVQYWPLP